jgi:hypothetical protein
MDCCLSQPPEKEPLLRLERSSLNWLSFTDGLLCPPIPFTLRKTLVAMQRALNKGKTLIWIAPSGQGVGVEPEAAPVPACSVPSCSTSVFTLTEGGHIWRPKPHPACCPELPQIPLYPFMHGQRQLCRCGRMLVTIHEGCGPANEHAPI